MEIKTKYNIGDTVYIIDGSRIKRAVIEDIWIAAIEGYMKISYRFKLYPMKSEAECFATKEELINHLKQ